MNAVNAVNADALDVLVENHRRFLAFLERRVGSRDVAEDVLQEAFVKSLDRVATVRDHAAVIPWFYRLLHNAVADHFRRAGAEDRALAHVAGIEDGTVDVDEAWQAQVCGCIAELAQTLKPEYAQAIKRIDLEGAAVVEFAREVGISANNAGVRLHRAHEALRRQLALSCRTCSVHGCLDCTCGRPAQRPDQKER